MTFHIACIGEPLVEISNGPAGLQLAFGGDTLNTAVYCARACEGHDISVSYVTAVGEDAASVAALKLMRDEGLSCDYIRQDPDRQIGLYAIQNDEDGERRFHYWRDTSAARQLFTHDGSREMQAIANADLIYLSGITLAILSQDRRDRLFAALDARRAAGGHVAFDSNYRMKLWTDTATARSETDRFWRVSDIGLPTIEDELAIFSESTAAEVIKRLASYGIEQGALKQGEQGPTAFDPNAQKHLTFATASQVIDTTGAGDSFNGAYLALFAQSASEAERLTQAHALAAQVVGHVGSIIPRTAK